MPSIRPTRAVTAVDRNVLLNRGHHGGLLSERTPGMLFSLAAFFGVGPYELVTCMEGARSGLAEGDEDAAAGAPLLRYE